MKFSFREAPEWFTNYVAEVYAAEFHEQVKDIDRYHTDRVGLLDAAVEFFSQKGFRVHRYNKELWFDLDETSEYTLLALKWS
jgi:hypothetical protein